MFKKLIIFIRKFISHTLFLVNLGFSVWLFICWYASTTNPEDIKYIGLVSLTTALPIITNFIFIIVWLFSRNKWRVILPVATLIFCRSLILPIWGINFLANNNLEPQLNGLKVLSWNVHGLGLFDKPLDKNKPEKIFQIIEKQQPDVACMIEFYTNNDGSNKVASEYFKKAGYKEYRFMYDNDFGSKIYIGNAIFSKYPIIEFEEIPIDEYIKMMRCDVMLPNNQRVRMFVVHLQSFLLADKDKVLIEKMKSNRSELEKNKSFSFSFIKKMHNAFVKRAPQAMLANAAISSSPYPTILCADLNDVPGSFTYTTIKGKMTDAFTQKGKMLGRTYNMLSPTLRIDYIFYDNKAFQLIGFKKVNTPTLSDHNMLIANFIPN